jgi:hypothetical protein
LDEDAEPEEGGQRVVEDEAGGVRRVTEKTMPEEE